ncbi:spore germination protein [Bacillus pinisoli]|uniref:spore germination protein n=1 Tax=Bacillus pinisoli TaxID=2901866 RepID=UPI001FF69DEB|nr:spore germination protein [Bacillus pinisoli]
MPSFVGGVYVDSVGDGAFTVGDAFRISPNGSAQDKGGAGTFNTGSFMRISNKKSSTGATDVDISDNVTSSFKPFIINF